jgi:hypothetical protein
MGGSLRTAFINPLPNPPEPGVGRFPACAKPHNQRGEKIDTDLVFVAQRRSDLRKQSPP